MWANCDVRKLALEEIEKILLAAGFTKEDRYL
jgi:hypothetical protein